MIPSKHILLVEAVDVLIRSGASPRQAEMALAPFRFVLSCQVLVQRAKLGELLDLLEVEGESNGGC